MSLVKMNAKTEVHKTLSLCNFCTSRLGISFIDELPSTLFDKLKLNLLFVFSMSALITLVAGEFAYVSSLLIGSTSVAEFVASLHIVGYGCMSISKCYTIYKKRHVFRQLICELIEIWPVNPESDEAAEIKRRSLTALRLGQFCYMFWNIIGVSFYCVTPLAVHVYNLSCGISSELGFVWSATYPIDKTKPVYHELVYIFETFSGLVAVSSMLGSDMMFSSMASHISMLLRLLQVKIRSIASSDNDDNHNYLSEQSLSDRYYREIVAVIKIHQRLISYIDDLEKVFSMVNLINVLLSSVNICCVVFNIVLLEPWIEISNKFFLGAVLTQIGILCWYADDLYRASIGISEAVYESGWYKSNVRCRRALLLVLQRSKKPLCFTALKFRKITLTTYTSILTTSYSYFTLLYTIYRD